MATGAPMGAVGPAAAASNSTGNQVFGARHELIFRSQGTLAVQLVMLQHAACRQVHTATKEGHGHVGQPFSRWVPGRPDATFDNDKRPMLDNSDTKKEKSTA